MEPADVLPALGLKAWLATAVRGARGAGAAAALVVALCGALGAGALLRLWNLGAQVMSGDEFHALFAARDRPVSQLLWRYQEADNCIPLSVLDRLLVDHGVAWREWLLRLPVLAAGLALLALGPLWAWRRLGARSAVALAWLLALSPGLVFYSRIARSYAPAALFGCAAVAAFEAWHRRGGLAPAAIYVGSAAMAIWFHLGSAPLVLSPFAVAALALAAPRGSTRRRALARLGLLAAAMTAALAALLLPAHRTLLPFLGGKHRPLDVSAAEAIEVGAWLAGVANRGVAAAVAAVFAAGLAILLRRHGWLAAFALAAVAGQLAGVLALAPVAHQSTVVLTRYLVFSLPWALVPVAAALGRPWPPRWRAAQPWLAAGACAGLFACGPFPDADLARSSFAHNELFLRFTTPRPRLGPEGPAAIYLWLAQAAPGAVIEMPWDPIHMPDRALGLYQTLHRRRVLVAGGPADPRFRFQNMTPSTPEALLSARGRWLVVHLAIVREAAHIGGMPWEPTRPLRRLFRGIALAEAAIYTASWGPPDYRDEWAHAWDLDRVRRQAPAFRLGADRGPAAAPACRTSPGQSGSGAGGAGAAGRSMPRAAAF